MPAFSRGDSEGRIGRGTAQTRGARKRTTRKRIFKVGVYVLNKKEAAMIENMMMENW